MKQWYCMYLFIEKHLKWFNLPQWNEDFPDVKLVALNIPGWDKAHVLQGI